MLEEVFEFQRTQLFKSLLDESWNNKKLWEHIRDRELTATPAFKGNKYDEARIKIMFVGRDLNGWDAELGNCSNLDKTVEAVLKQNPTYQLNTLVCEEGFGEKGRRTYKHINSKYFRFIKHILENIGESEKDIDATFYDDKKSWNQKFIWANLFCISPRKPKDVSESHFDKKEIKKQVECYVDLMQLYVEHYNPDVVVFITDVNGWFIPWKRKKSFKDILDEGSYCEHLEQEVIVATGLIGKTRVIVCKRPDRWMYSYEKVAKKARVVSDYIKIIE